MNDTTHHPLITEVIRHIAEQKTKRIGFDGKGYTQEEFVTEYGEVGLQYWREAPHYECLSDLLREWGLSAWRRRSYGTEEARNAYIGEFGVLFPGLLSSNICLIRIDLQNERAKKKAIRKKR